MKPTRSKRNDTREFKPGTIATYFFAVVCACLLPLALGGCGTAAESMRAGRAHGSLGADIANSGDYELANLQTRDGTKIVAQFGRALDENDIPRADYSTRPTVIYCYPGNHTLGESQKLFNGFRRLGMNIVIPEYPGFGMSEGRRSVNGCYAAADAAYDYVLGRPDLDHQKIYAAGWSAGGGAAVDLASHRPVIGLLVISTSTELADVVHEMADQSLRPSWLSDRKVKLDSLWTIQSVACPIVLIYGTADKLIPVMSSATPAS